MKKESAGSAGESNKPATVLTITEVTNINSFFQIIKKLSPHSELIVIEENTPREIILEALKIGCSYYIEPTSGSTNMREEAKSQFNKKEREERTDINQDGVAKETKHISGVKANPPLSRREQEVLYELLMGKNNREIAQALGITEQTVKNHLWNAYKKYDVLSRTQLFHKLLSECPCLNILETLKPNKPSETDKVIEKLFPITS